MPPFQSLSYAFSFPAIQYVTKERHQQQFSISERIASVTDVRQLQIKV